MTKEEIKKTVINNAKIFATPQPIGGQQCGVMTRECNLISEDLSLEIKFSYHRSQLKNKEMLKTILELVVDQLIR